jgi:trigger factor
MNITKEQTSELTATIHIAIERNDYEEEVNKSLKEYQRKASMPGFRPGKVPLGMVKKMYGKALIADKVNTLISDALNNYIVDNKLAILGHPVANMDKTGTLDFDGQEELNFYFDIGLAPDFSLDFDGMKKPEYIKAKAGEEAIEQAIDNILSQASKTVDVDEARIGDTVMLRVFEADAAGNEIEEGFQNTFNLPLSDIKESAQQIFVGKPVGSEFVVNFSDLFDDDSHIIDLLGLDDSNKNLATSPFNVIVDEIKRIEKAELNEELFKEVYPDDDIAGIEDFRSRVALDVERQYRHDTDRYFFNKAIDAILDHHNFDMPDEFMKKWVIDNNDGKITAEDIEKDYENYSKTFRWQLILSKLEAENEQLAVQPIEIRNFVKAYFFGRMYAPEQIDDEMDKRMDGIVDSILQNKDEERKIKEQIADQKLMTFVKEKLKPEEISMNYDDFVKLATENNNKDE